MESPDKRIDLVLSLAAERDFVSAQVELERLRKGNDTSSAYPGELYYLEGLIFFGQARYGEALKKAQSAYQLLKHTLKNRRIAQVHLLMGNILIATGELKRAEIEIQDAKASFRRAGDEKGIADAYNKLAQIFFIQAEFDRSIECLNQATEHAKKIKEGQLMIARLSGNLSRIYLLMGEWTKAQRHLHESIRQNELIKNEISNCRNLLSLGYAACQQRKFKEAEGFYEKALNIIQKKYLERELAIYHEYRGELAFEQKEYDQSYRNVSQAIQIGEKIAPQSSLVCQSYRILAQLQLATQRLNLAESSCQKAVELSKHLNEKAEEGIVYRVWGQILAQKNNKKLAKENFKLSMTCLEKIGCKFELAKTYLCAGEETVFDPKERLEYLSKAKHLFGELFSEKSTGFAYYMGSVQFGEALALFEIQDYDNSIDSLNEAEALLGEFKAEKSPVEEEKRLEISKFRLKVEKVVAEKSISFDNRYNIFRRFLSEIESNQVSAERPANQEEEICQNLNLLAKKLQADRGFILLKNGEDQTLSPNFSFNLSSEEIEQIRSTLYRLNGELTSLSKPVYSTSGKTNLFSGNKQEVLSLLLVPLKIGEELKGVLYLDRKKNGPFTKPFRRDELNLTVAFADIIALKLAEIENKKLGEENLRLKQQLKEKSAFSNIITQNSQLLEILWKLSQVKDTNLSILLEGETGTGKDQIAKAIHYNSNRKNKNFVVVNCAAYPETLLENELFGHKKGAYTGASQDKKGLIEEADGGTLYLDEIAEINPATQIKLLRVLEEKELTRLGETRPKKVDIRVISATSLNIKEQIEKGLFRKDLFFRLNTIHVQLPPLRDRKEDISLLVNHFIKIHTANGGSKLSQPSPAIMELLANYDWPGNIRELENEVKRLVAIKDGESVVAADMLTEKFGMKEDQSFSDLSLYERVATWERQFILKALIESNWVKKAAAASLRIPESSLRFKIKQLKIKIPTQA
ncbi:MAG: sigma 54-interacting transcriptional regulator [candidate division Zixibacteria bacterium]|nr:sigma 54-interacting transcriptional regulator [candidate division Zixibacteria bacterium]